MDVDGVNAELPQEKHKFRVVIEFLNKNIGKEMSSKEATEGAFPGKHLTASDTSTVGSWLTLLTVLGSVERVQLEGRKVNYRIVAATTLPE